MTFEDVLDQAIAMLRRRGRVTYRTLKRQFNLDDEALEDLKEELIEAEQLAVDQDGKMLVWAGDDTSSPAPVPIHSTQESAAPPASAPVADHKPPPISYTPQYLTEKILTSRSALEGERKQVTVLFVDVSGFTSLSEKLDPEDVHQLMERAFELMLDEVHRYEGTVNQFLGDGIMALFGAPIAHEDHPVRAVYAALGMQRALATYHDQLHAQRGIHFQVRLGLNTGAVVVGKIGDNLRMDYTAVGDTTNLASRLEKLAESGGILVGEATAKAVEAYFHLQPLGEVTVKGKVEPVRPYCVQGSRGVRSRLEAVTERGLTPLVGRDRELALLQDRFAEVQSGRGQAVFVYGEAGIGKSRLLLEFRRRVEAMGVRWLVGRCVSYGRSMAYLPMLNVVRELTDIQEADDVGTILRKIDTGIGGVGEQVAWTVPFVRTLLSLDPGDPDVAALTPIHRRGRVAEALRVLLLDVSQHQPVVLFVEDLHWIDAHSEEIVHLLLEGVAAAPVLVLLTHRPGYTPLFGDQTYYTRVTLHRLSDTQIVAMIEGVLQSAGVPAEVLDLIARRAEGNPLFIEELCKSLLEDGTLQRTNGGYCLTHMPDQMAIPGTIQDVIMARIDRLPETSKAALQIASVIGREFTARLIERVSSMQREAPHALGELRAVELIYEKSIFPELSYMFKHALTHDVAYESLLRQHRKDLHRRVGEVIEELYAERLPEFYETLAWHYGQGEVWPKAVEYLLKAADQARSRFAYAEAVRYCEEAIDILERHGGAPDAMMCACEALGDLRSLLGQVDPANQAYDRALDVVDTPATRQWLVNKRHRLGMAVRDGANIAYYEHGSGEPSLFLTHPLVYGISTWQPLVELLCQECRVIVVEPRGVGKSDPLSGIYLLRDHVEDARAVIEATGGRPVVFFGLSRAGALAVNFAAAYPHLVEKLVLVGSHPARPGAADYPAQVDPEFWQWRQQVRAKVQTGDYEEAMQMFSSYVYSEPGSRNLIEVRMQLVRETPGEIIRNFFLVDDPGLELCPLLPTLQMPALVLHGEADRVAPVEAGRYLVDHIPDAQFYLFKGRGHNPIATATAEFAQVVRTFIRTGRPT
jgi:class 3 adenylate cyclase/pimeloyl-ACP methyl ester carboxylesterase